MSYSFTELLQQFDIPYHDEGHEHCRPGWVQIDCPYCGLEGHFRLGYNLASKYLNCWACGPHRLIDTLMELTGLPFGKIRPLIDGVESEAPIPEIKRSGKLILPKGLGDLKLAHKKYLRERGFNPKKIQQLWGIQGIGMAVDLKWRIWIPISFQGEIVSWTTRSLKNEGVRYISASPGQEKINHKNLLYGEDYCRHAIIINEGPTDVWNIGPGATATFGTGFKRPQVLRMTKYPVRVVCLDNAPEAQERARELLELLEPYPGETYNVVLDAKDPGSAKPKEIRRLRRMFLE